MPRQKPILGSLPTLAALLEHLKIDERAWDILLIGDGSGGSWEMGAGWACVIIDKQSKARKLLYGAMNPGTVMLGELLPYIHGLAWFNSNNGPGKRRVKAKLSAGELLRVHIVTDNAAIAGIGSGKMACVANREIWEALFAFRKRGYQLFFHHVPREAINLHLLVDEISRCARKSLADVKANALRNLVNRFPDMPAAVTIYDFSPF